MARTPVNDNFDRSNSSTLGSPWTNTGFPGSPQIYSNTVYGSSGSLYSASLRPAGHADQSSEIQYKGMNTNGQFGVICRGDDAGNGYMLWVDYGDGVGYSAHIGKITGDLSAPTNLDTAVVITLTMDDIFKLDVTGDLLTAYQNDVAITGLTATDSSYTAAGNYGIYASRDSTGLDNWEGTYEAVTAYTLTAEQGSYSLSGQTATLVASNRVTAESGTYALTGSDATLTHNTARTLIADYGTYTVTGSEALIDLSMNAAQGTYTLTGQDATLNYGNINLFTLVAEVGTYTLTGQDVNLLYYHYFPLVAEQGTYTLSGKLAQLTWSGAPIVTGYVNKGMTISRMRIGL